MRQTQHHAANMAKMKNACTRFVGKPKGKNQLGGKGIDGRITLRWI
jgi:hypothetical protein